MPTTRRGIETCEDLTRRLYFRNIGIRSRLVALLLLLWRPCSVTGYQSSNSCHPARSKNAASNCKKITLPRGLCSACDINKVNGKGSFLDCTRTMHTERRSCRTKFVKYLRKNPCDTARAEAWEEFQSTDPEIAEQGRSKIDFFLYSVCEQCEYQLLAHRPNVRETSYI